MSDPSKPPDDSSVSEPASEPAPAAVHPKVKMIHTTPLFGGEMTAEEVWIVALNKPCYVCGFPGVTLASTLILWADLWRQCPDVAGAILARSEDGVTPPLIRTKMGPMVCVAEVAACKQCTKRLEQEASAGEKKWSKKGLGVLVEFRYGPGPDNKIVPVGGPGVTPVN